MMTPRAIVDTMLSKDAFSQWLGIQILEVKEGFAKIQMTVRPEMVNGFGIAHGGISFSFADSAFAFASNSRGKHAVSTEVSISHLSAIQVGDRLTAVSSEIKNGRQIAVYSIKISNQDDKLVAHFKGNVFKMEKGWTE